MKKRKLLLLGFLLAIGTSLFAGTVRMKTAKAVGENFSFAVNSGVKLTLAWDGGSSEELMATGQIQTVTLKSQSLTISSEANITSLYLADNDLTELNVAGIASTLRSLCCANNQLKTLSLSGCTNLVQLDCQGNQLSTLALSGTKMEVLNVADNQLTSLGLSNGANLKSLVCANNRLSSLSILSSASQLTAVFCQSNQISSLPAISNTNLKHMLAFGNRLRAIDLSKLTALEDLWLAGNQLKTLDVSAQKSLVGLVADNNALTTITWDGTSARNKLLYFDISSNQLSFNSFPTIYTPSTDTYTLKGGIMPQSATQMLSDMPVNQLTDASFSALIQRNGWGVATAAEVNLTDENGKVLEKDVDYTFVTSRLKFLTQPHNGVVLTVTSKYYPGIEIKSLPFNITESTDGIDGLELDAQEGDIRVYDLQGRRMNPSSLKKGIYVVNGRKVIIR